MEWLTDATTASLREAAALNTTEWVLRCAVAGHGEVERRPGVTWTQHAGGSAVLFPRFADDRCSERIEEFITYFRDRQPSDLVGCWSLDPPVPPDLGARLLARFQPGWQPHWMCLDLSRSPHVERGRDGHVAMVEDGSIWERFDHPYLAPNEGPNWREQAKVKHAVAEIRPQHVWHFASWLDGRPVGAATLHLTTGPLGVAGIYDVGVLPDMRRRGIGASVSVHACDFARALGCRYAVLNATGMGAPVYRSIGFESIGHGLTWWLNVPRLNAHPPTELQVALAEAVGRGDVVGLDALSKRVTGELLDQPLTNGMRLLEIAQDLQQQGSARWLCGHGASVGLLLAWDLGWKDRVLDLIRSDPGLINRPFGDERATALHHAVWRGDIELARLLLTHGADATIPDGVDGSTPLLFAQQRGRTEILAMMEAIRRG